MYVFITSYYCSEHLYQTIDSLLYHSDLKIIVCENHSKRSCHTIPYLKVNYLDKGLIQNIVYFKDNVGANAVPYAIDKFWDKRDHFLYTDQDVIINRDFDWIGIMRHLLITEPKVSMVLNKLNPLLNELVEPSLVLHYTSGFSPYKELSNVYLGASGMQMAMLHKDFYMHWEEQSNKYFIDTQLRQFAIDNNYLTLTVDNNAYHLGWDTWRDFPEYYQEKKSKYLKGTDWWVTTPIDPSRIEVY